MILNHTSKIVFSFLIFIFLTTTSVSSSNTELDKLNRGTWVGKLITTDVKQTVSEMREVNHLCQYIKSDEKLNFSDVVNKKIEVEGSLTDEYFVMSMHMSSKDIISFPEPSKMYCVINTEFIKPGTFKGKQVVYVSGSIAISDSIKVRIASQANNINKPNVQQKSGETLIFKCKDKNGRLVFKDSPCEENQN